MSTLFLDNLKEHAAVFEALPALSPVVSEASALMAEAVKAGGKVMFCGNGGSAADSQHLAAELTGRFIKDRRPLAGLALSTDSSALTCIGNDYGFDEVFARQVSALDTEDIAAFSTQQIQALGSVQIAGFSTRQVTANGTLNASNHCAAACQDNSPRSSNCTARSIMRRISCR